MIRTVLAGIDIGGTNIKYGLIEPSGPIVVRRQIPTPQESSAEAVFEKVKYCGEQLLIEADDLSGQVAYIGVGSPGCINTVTGTVEGTCPNIPGWSGFSLRDRLHDALNLPIFVDNDANCAALAEFRFGAGKGSSHLICITVGTGIGGGIIISGRLFRGASFSAGEIGHMRIPRVGGSGLSYAHLESLVSSRSILARMKDLNGKDDTEENIPVPDNGDSLTIRKIFALAKRGNIAARNIIDEAGETLGMALVNLVNVFNPELIVIGGGVAEGGGGFVEKVRQTLFEKALVSATRGMKVVPAQLGNAAGFIGAALLGDELRSTGSG